MNENRQAYKSQWLRRGLALAAMEKGDAAARWIAAATLDRYLQKVQQPQVFGTQYRWDGPSRATSTQQPE